MWRRRAIANSRAAWWDEHRQSARKGNIPRRMAKKRKVEIVGAGFAGLAAACAFAQRGWSVRVHERADELRTTGAGIYVYENGLRVLEALGAYAEAVRGAPVANTREVRDDRNRVVSVHRWDNSARVFSIVRQQV